MYKNIIYSLAFVAWIFSSQVCAQNRYVSVSGAGSQDGTSEANAWTLAQAQANAAPGMTIYVKAGNYGASTWSFTKSGTSTNPIIWEGYASTAGDVVANNGSTFTYGDTPSSSAMPLFDGNFSTDTGWNVTADYVHFKNFQFMEFNLFGIITNNGDGLLFDNIIIYQTGPQNTDNYTVAFNNNGCNNCTWKNLYIEDSTGNGFRHAGGGNGTIQFLEVQARNVVGPTDYYCLLTQTSNNLIEDLRLYRGDGLPHGGHGLILKHDVTGTIARRLDIYGTNIELNFGDVTNNYIEDFELENRGTGTGNWQTSIDIRNGASDNTFNKGYIHNTYSALYFIDFDDGYTPNPDTDELDCGNNNFLYNIVIENVGRLVTVNGNTSIGGSNSAPWNNNTFDGITGDGYSLLASVTQPNSGNTWKNSSFTNGGIVGSGGEGHSNNVAFSYSNFYTAPAPTGAGITTNAPAYTNSGGGALDYQLTVSSPLIGAGIATSNLIDYNGLTRPNPPSQGAFEYSSGGGDTTPPSVTSVAVEDITDTSFRVDWSLNEASKGQIRFGTSSGTYTQTTGLENSFLTRHIQPVGGSNPSPLTPGTTYYWQIYVEDAAGNTDYHTEQTTTTAGSPPDPPEPPPTQGVVSRLVKTKKM